MTQPSDEYVKKVGFRGGTIYIYIYIQGIFGMAWGALCFFKPSLWSPLRPKHQNCLRRAEQLAHSQLGCSSHRWGGCLRKTSRRLHIYIYIHIYILLYILFYIYIYKYTYIHTLVLCIFTLRIAMSAMLGF